MKFFSNFSKCQFYTDKEFYFGGYTYNFCTRLLDCLVDRPFARMQIRNPFVGNVKVGEGNAIVSLQLSYKFLQLLVWVNHLQEPISKIISLNYILHRYRTRANKGRS